MIKLRIPYLVDLTIVDRADRISELDGRPQVSREPHGAGGLLGRWLTGRLFERLRVGDVMLPTFVDRDAPGRAVVLDELQRRLARVDLGAAHHRGDLAQLAAYVCGRDVPFELLAQQIVGRCFDPGFRASAQSYHDAALIAGWASKPSPHALWRQLTGELERARERMWALCRQDRMMLHGTVLALPNLREALVRMRALFASQRGLATQAMLQRCLEGPPRLLRVVRAPVASDDGELSLRSGGLLLFDLKTARARQPNLDVFFRGVWNQCPAHALVPRILGAVWERAQLDTRRPRALRTMQSGRPLPVLDETARRELTPGNLETLAQWELDQLYSQLEAGPIPHGPFEGRFFFAQDGGLRSFAQAVPGLGVRLADLQLRRVEQLGALLWKGKMFFPELGVLRNIVENADAVAPLFGVPSAALRRSVIDGREVALMFPARVFHGESLTDPERASIIIDYDDGARIDGYLPRVDFLAARPGLRIRDEIRRIRPGLYLGYAYADQRLLLMFTLYNPQLEAAAEGLHEAPHKGNGAPRAVGYAE